MAKPCVIVDQGYCVPNRVELAVTRETAKLMDGKFVIKDVKGNLLFQPMFGLTNGVMVLLDGSKSPVLTMKKRTSLHGKWQVFRGLSTEKKDLLCTVKRSHMVNVMTEIDVFLSHNKKEEICDFKVKGALYMRDCVVYASESDTIVAEMQKKRTVEGGGDYFSVEIYPNIDSAFIASLVIILDHLIRQDRAYAEEPDSEDDADTVVNDVYTGKVGNTANDDDNSVVEDTNTGVDDANIKEADSTTVDDTTTVVEDVNPTVDDENTSVNDANTAVEDANTEEADNNVVDDANTPVDDVNTTVEEVNTEETDNTVVDDTITVVEDVNTVVDNAYAEKADNSVVDDTITAVDDAYTEEADITGGDDAKIDVDDANIAVDDAYVGEVEDDACDGEAEEDADTAVDDDDDDDDDC